MKNAKIVAAVLLTFLGIALLAQLAKSEKQVAFPNNTKIQIEIADTSLKRATGLMYRKSLPQNQGMLFIFDETAKHIFWMKNTLVPLDIIWLDENFKIVDISRSTPPCTTQKCQTYMPSSPAKYVLEVNSGISEQNNLKIGDQLKFAGEN